MQGNIMTISGDSRLGRVSYAIVLVLMCLAAAIRWWTAN